jgi:hypothetical protein
VNRLALLGAAIAALSPALAEAQTEDTAVATASGAAALPAPPPAAVARIPRERPISPLRDRFDPEDRGPHGQVGATVGTNGVRGAYGHIESRPAPNVSISVSGAYGQNMGYAGPYGPDPMLGRPPAPPPQGETVEILSGDPPE